MLYWFGPHDQFGPACPLWDEPDPDNPPAPANGDDIPDPTIPSDQPPEPTPTPGLVPEEQDPVLREIRKTRRAVIKHLRAARKRDRDEVVEPEEIPQPIVEPEETRPQDVFERIAHAIGGTKKNG